MKLDPRTLLAGIAFLPLAASCNYESPTAPAGPDASSQRAVSSSAAGLEGDPVCPQGFDPVVENSPLYDASADKNGDGVVCVRSARSGRVVVVDNAVDGRSSTGGLVIGLAGEG